jgi:hypothetical protein
MPDCHTPDADGYYWPAYYASLPEDQQEWARGWLDALSQELDEHIDDYNSAKIAGNDDFRRAVIAQLFANLNAVSNLHTGSWDAKEMGAT